MIVIKLALLVSVHVGATVNFVLDADCFTRVSLHICHEHLVVGHLNNDSVNSLLLATEQKVALVDNIVEPVLTLLVNGVIDCRVLEVVGEPLRVFKVADFAELSHFAVQQ